MSNESNLNDNVSGRLIVVDCESIKSYDFIKKINKDDSVILVGDKDTEINASAMMSLVSIGCKLDYRELPISSRFRVEYLMFLLGQLSNKDNLVLVTESPVLNEIIKKLNPSISILSVSVSSFNNFDGLINDSGEVDDCEIEEVEVPDLNKWKDSSYSNNGRVLIETLKSKEQFEIESNRNIDSLSERYFS